MTASSQITTDWTAEDLVVRFGPIPLRRIRMSPPPGTATEKDVMEIEQRENRLCELVDGVLVEKVMGTHESALAVHLIAALYAFVRPRGLGIVLGADGMLRFAPGLVRIPDVSFIASSKLVNGQLSPEAIAQLVPDLAAEFLTTGNTPAEMNRKLREYFDHGTRGVWYVDLKARQVRVYRSPDECQVLKTGDILDGADVLPGFTLEVSQLFS